MICKRKTNTQSSSEGSEEKVGQKRKRKLLETTVNLEEDRKKKCFHCGKVFICRPERVKTAKFCCLKCRRDHYDNEQVCKNCGKVFKRPNKRECCSMRCRIELHTIKRKCKLCGKIFVAKRSIIEKGEGLFCCKRHADISRRNSSSFRRWGYTFYETVGGYFMSRTPHKRYHVLVWERENGKVPSGCIIHHIDGNVKNNKLSNLQMMTSSAHMRLHEGLRRERKEAFLRTMGKVE